MTAEGPLLERLTHRLSECPSDFLGEPVIGSRGSVRVDAVISDLLQDLGGAPLDEAGARPFAAPDRERRNCLRLALICAHLLHDDWFLDARRFAPAARAWLEGGLEGLSELVAPDLFVTDPDRREELVRLCLRALGLRPAGETEAQAADRITTLSSVERQKVIRATRDQLERARQIREAMARKAAEEAAAKEIRE